MPSSNRNLIRNNTIRNTDRKARVSVPAAATASPDGPALTAALAEIERLREEARVMRTTHEEALRLATQHETSLERVWRKLSGG